MHAKQIFFQQMNHDQTRLKSALYQLYTHEIKMTQKRRCNVILRVYLSYLA